jgi:hypothetical protein
VKRAANSVLVLTLLFVFGCHLDTMGERREIRSAQDLAWAAKQLRAYRVTHGAFPAARENEQLRQALGGNPVLNDAWGVAFKYEVTDDGQHYRISSAGSDRQFETVLPIPNRPGREVFSDLARDIIVQDGDFLRFHECATSAVRKAGT